MIDDQPASVDGGANAATAEVMERPKKVRGMDDWIDWMHAAMGKEQQQWWAGGGSRCRKRMNNRKIGSVFSRLFFLYKLEGSFKYFWVVRADEEVDE